MKKKLLYLAVACVMSCSTAIASYGQSIPTVYSPGIMLTGMSDNAAYAISSTVADDNVDNPRVAGGTLVDLKAQKHITIEAPSGWADVNDVADDGTVVGSSEGKPGSWSPVSGEWTTYDIPSQWGGGCFTAVTPDAHYAVGYFFDPQNEYYVYPMMYDLTTGENKILKNLPSRDLTGVDQHQNVFYAISPDGRYVLGQMSQSYWMPVALFTYVYDTQNCTWKPLGYTYDEDTTEYTSRVDNLHFVTNQFMSCDGQWVTGSAYMVFSGGEMEGGSETFYPYRYNVATDTFEVLTSDNDANIGGNKITSDGIMLGSSPMDSPYPTAVIRTGNFFVTLDQIIQQVYGMAVEDLIHDTVTGAFQALSADGLTALMCTYDNSYVITMPETFIEAAKKVDLLANYTSNIPDGTALSRLSEIQLTFDRTIGLQSAPQNIKLLDGQGNTVRAASGFMISPSNDHTAVVTFRSTALTPGETYTVDIPEGMIWLKEDTSVKTRAISLHYTGRQEGPVQMVSVNPPTGSAIAELNASPDNITITFDTPVSVTGKGTCLLYNEEGDIVTSFNALVSGADVTFFPTATFYLYKGNEYRIVISEGTVTDLSGAGANEEIVLNYTGTYVRQISSDDLYIFKSTCDNYDDFIFWKDQFNEPAEIPAAWGFTSETPWVLVSESTESTDMALAAHSMFTTPAESDDWLITPQLYLPDANTYLAFDAQSYKSSRDDVLKVYVYESNATYNYFSQELAEAFKADGALIIDEVIPAGATQEGLSGEWTHYTVPLDKYAGKNIYIAFVNNNYDKSAIFIDNVQVIRNMDFMVTNQTPTAMVNAEQVTVSGIVSVASEIADFTGITVRLLGSDLAVIDEVSDADIKLQYGDTYRYTFDTPLQLTPGQITQYTIQVASGNESVSHNYSVKDLIFEPVKRVVLEEYTGSKCPNCPLGIQAIATLESMYPDNFIPLTLRTYLDDMYAAGAVEYTAYLGLTAAPSARINRGSILMPTVVNQTRDDILFFGKGMTDEDGSPVYLWGDALQDELNVPAEAEVTFTALYDATTGDIQIPCNVRFAIDREQMSLGVFAVVTENALQTYQQNNMYASTYPSIGEWGIGGMYGQMTVTTWLADDVVRFVVNDNAFNGTLMPQTDFEAGADYAMTLTSTVPNGRLKNTDNCEVVVMLIDRTTGSIINANRMPITLAGISNIESDTEAEANYYNMQGVKVTNPARGQIYIRVIGGKADKIRY